MMAWFCQTCLRDFEGEVPYDPATGRSECNECEAGHNAGPEHFCKERDPNGLERDRHASALLEAQRNGLVVSGIPGPEGIPGDPQAGQSKSDPEVRDAGPRDLGVE